MTLVNTGTAGAMNNLKIPLGALIAWLIFGETIRLPSFLVAAGLMVVAVVLATGSLFPEKIKPDAHA